jgi:hypothetical protein
MRDRNWLESREKKSHWYYYAVVIAVAAIAMAVFIRNNKDLFFTKSEKIAPPVKEPISTKPPQHVAEARHAPAKAPDRPPQSVSVSSRASLADSVFLEDIVCRLRDRESLSVVLSLELFFASDGPIKREILLKRDNLKVMVQKALVGKSMQELIVDSLRAQVKTAMDRILENGTLRDVKFRKFSIDKVQ